MQLREEQGSSPQCQASGLSWPSLSSGRCAQGCQEPITAGTSPPFLTHSGGAQSPHLAKEPPQNPLQCECWGGRHETNLGQDWCPWKVVQGLTLPTREVGTYRERCEGHAHPSKAVQRQRDEDQHRQGWGRGRKCSNATLPGQEPKVGAQNGRVAWCPAHPPAPHWVMLPGSPRREAMPPCPASPRSHSQSGLLAP